MRPEVIGREAELAVVEAFLDRPAPGLRALVLEGEPGIGKSTLWLAGVAAARERAFRVLVSRPAETERMLPGVVLGDLFGDVPPEAMAALSAPRRHAFRSALLLQEAPDAPIDPRALGVAILTLLPLLGAGQQLVLAIDDDQWVDPTSAATLHFALRRLQDQPLCLLLSRRTGGAPAIVLDDAIDPSAVERLALGPLTVAGIELLIRSRLGLSFPRPTLARIHEVSGGNSFFALELARSHASNPDRDATVPLAVPRRLEVLVAGRFEALAPATRLVLLLVAAHGRLPVRLLQALDVPPDALADARAANVIDPEHGVIRFTHPLLASTLYQEASPEERSDAHRRLAMVVDDPIHRARHHALAADEPSADLAATLESAAGIARDRGMPIAAAELAEHALRLTPSDALVDRHRRAIFAARSHWAAGDGSRARTIAADLVAGAAAGRARAEALVLRAELELPARAVATLRIALSEAASSPELRSAIHAALAGSGYMGWTNGRAWAERHARAALAIAERLDDDALRADALSILAFLGFSRGDPRALELAERAYRLATTLPDPRYAMLAAVAVGHVLAWSGGADPARQWLERRLADWGDRDERTRSDLLWYLALVELWAGRWGIAGDHAEQVRVNAQYGDELPQDAYPAALVALHRGQFAVARELSRRALARTEGQPWDFYFAILATCDLWSGDPTAAHANFVRAEEAADTTGSDDPSLRGWRAEHVEALLQLGRIDEAIQLTDDWEVAAQKLGRQRVLAQALRCRGLIAAASGDTATALDLLEEAAAQHEAADDPFGRARAFLALGTTRRHARQKRSARDALEAALAGFEALGADSWAAAVRGELSRIGGRQRVAGLSASEMSVANLVVEGRTNREIAAALFLSERTVAGHLTHIYAKLGLRSRTELAQQMGPGPGMSRGSASNIERS